MNIILVYDQNELCQKCHKEMEKKGILEDITNLYVNDKIERNYLMYECLNCKTSIKIKLKIFKYI